MRASNCLRPGISSKMPRVKLSWVFNLGLYFRVVLILDVAIRIAGFGSKVVVDHRPDRSDRWR